ncbi:hypothetical protein NUW54_g12983 [Trametes sanguinea]|uniref:Uncharacterized protein n=1 Tax=Trametes sanguinea TaxID=158606 RepID=A0ACC1MRX9_9APHY|nr:hypothetical protein NUW54_g12983 [Trametes sanguinea]
MEPLSASRPMHTEGPLRTNSGGSGRLTKEERAGSSAPYPQPSASALKVSVSGHRGTRYKEKWVVPVAYPRPRD